MALKIPTLFADDIRGRDTNLVPVVAINLTSSSAGYEHSAQSNLLIAADVRNLELMKQIGDTWAFSNLYLDTIPMLLNIPSLKESIDIEKRNYKISSINIDISNFPYENKRFSEIVGDSSLVNKECRVFWVSPKTKNIAYYDGHAFDSTLSMGDSDAFLAYSGVIRRYNHDSDKCRLVVEDRTQASMHIELPSSNIGVNPDIPEKFRNKPKPMVYGAVDKSPLVFETEFTPPVPGDISAGEQKVKLHCDYRAITLSNKLLLHDGDNYYELTKTQEYTQFGFGSSVYAGGNAYDIIGGKEYHIYVKEGAAEALGSNKAHLKIPDAPRITKAEIKYSEDVLNNDLNFQSTGVIDGINSSTGLPNAITFSSNSTPPNTPLELTGNMFYIREIPSHIFYGIPTITWSVGNYTDDIIDYGSFGDNHPNDEWATPVHIYYNLGQTVPGGLDGYKEINNFSSDQATFDLSSQAYIDSNRDITFSMSAISGISHDLVKEVYNYADPTTETIEVFTIPANMHSTDGFRRIPTIIRLQLEHDADENMMSWVRLNLNEFSVSIDLFGKDIFNNDFFAGDVIGRVGSTPTAPAIISDILENELKVTNIDSSDYSAYNTWNYAFTIDKRINSKKLLEGISSASPYFGHFDSTGTFKYNFIRGSFNNFNVESLSNEYGNGAGASGNHTVKEADVIDFSFSRTPIEEVYTKIEFLYKYDYAQGEFANRRVLDVDVFTCMDIDDSGDPQGYTDTYDYYGFKRSEANSIYGDHTNTTLLIDDDRGKYIRSDSTAERFITWMLSWHMNQHLIMKVKLPLKYMNLEIGDYIKFNKVLGDIKPYNIDYSLATTPAFASYQQFHPFFLITATNKTLEWVEISCVQMHTLWSDVAGVGGFTVNPDGVMFHSGMVSGSRTGCDTMTGCTDVFACNFDPLANEDNGSCVYTDGVDYCVDYDQDGDGDAGSPHRQFCCETTAECGYLSAEYNSYTSNCVQGEDDDCVSNIHDCDGVCDGDAVWDCQNPPVCGTGFVVDACGECGGAGLGSCCVHSRDECEDCDGCFWNEQSSKCFANVATNCDQYGINPGTGTYGCCGDTGCACACGGAILGCDGVCGSGYINDCDGVCGADVDPEDWHVEDVNGDCCYSWLLDNCGICNGDNDCAGALGAMYWAIASGNHTLDDDMLPTRTTMSGSAANTPGWIFGRVIENFEFSGGDLYGEPDWTPPWATLNDYAQFVPLLSMNCVDWCLGEDDPDACINSCASQVGIVDDLGNIQINYQNGENLYNCVTLDGIEESTHTYSDDDPNASNLGHVKMSHFYLGIVLDIQVPGFWNDMWVPEDIGGEWGDDWEKALWIKFRLQINRIDPSTGVCVDLLNNYFRPEYAPVDPYATESEYIFYFRIPQLTPAQIEQEEPVVLHFASDNWKFLEYPPVSSPTPWGGYYTGGIEYVTVQHRIDILKALYLFQQPGEYGDLIPDDPIINDDTNFVLNFPSVEVQRIQADMGMWIQPDQTDAPPLPDPPFTPGGSMGEVTVADLNLPNIIPGQMVIYHYPYRPMMCDCDILLTDAGTFTGGVGDVDGDGAFSVLDIVQLANCVLADNCHETDTFYAPPICADMNGDGMWNVLDIVQLANCILEQSCTGYHTGG